jgi:hypothetical protein
MATLCVFQGHCTVVGTLLEMGAFNNVPGSHGETAIIKVHAQNDSLCQRARGLVMYAVVHVYWQSRP